MFAPTLSTRIAAVHETPLFWFDQYQTSVVVPTTTSSQPSPFTSPTPRTWIAFPGLYAGSGVKITVPVVPDPVRMRTVVPNAMTISRPVWVPEMFPNLTPTSAVPAGEDAPDGGRRP